jgi:hypothetical protein
MGGSSSKPIGDKLTNLPTNYIANTQIVQNLETASGLLDKFKSNDMSALINYIKSNPKLSSDLGIDLSNPNDNPLKIVEEFNKKFTQHLNGRNLQDILKSTDFFKFIKETELKTLDEAKTKVLSSDILKHSPEEKGKIGTIFENIATIRAKEQYYKYEYLLTQIWIIAYIKNMNTTIIDFTEKTLTMVKKNEEQRNEYTKQMLHTLLQIMIEAESDINEKDFDFFKKALASFETKLYQSTTELNDEIRKEATRVQSVQALQNQQKVNTVVGGFAGAASSAKKGGFVRDGSRFPAAAFAAEQDGGFVRDGSRFPQAFYELP